MNLPALYAAVCAKRPDLAVKSMGIVPVMLYYSETCFGWYWDDDSLQHLRHVNHRVAAALILARWVEALPSCVCLQRSLDGWRCSSIASCGMMPSVRHSTPLEALAAYYLGEAT